MNYGNNENQFGKDQNETLAEYSLDMKSIYPMIIQNDPLTNPKLGTELLKMIDDVESCISHYNDMFKSISEHWDSDIATMKKGYKDQREKCWNDQKKYIDEVTNRMASARTELNARRNNSTIRLDEEFDSRVKEMLQQKQEELKQITSGQRDIKINWSVSTDLSSKYNSLLLYLENQDSVRRLWHSIVFDKEIKEYACSYTPSINSVKAAENALEDERLEQAKRSLESVKQECEKIIRQPDSILKYSQEIVRLNKDAEAGKEFLLQYNQEYRKELINDVENKYMKEQSNFETSKTKALETLYRALDQEQDQLEKDEEKTKQEIELKTQSVKQKTNSLTEEENRTEAALINNKTEALSKIINDFYGTLEIVFPEEKIKLFFQKIHSGLDYDIYDKKGQINNVGIGKVYVELDPGKVSDPSFFEAVKKTFNEKYSCFTGLEKDTLRFRVPFFVSPEIGISILMKYDQGADQEIKDIVNMIGVRVMMNIPASLLEFCLVDSAAVGSFAELMSLNPAPAYRGGNSQAKNILLGNEVQRFDAGIKKQIGGMWTRYNNLISSFQEKETTLRGFNESHSVSKETYQFVIAQHFPAGFDQDVITQLTALARDCGSAGFSSVVAMQTNNPMLDNLDTSQMEAQMDVLRYIGNRKFSLITKDEHQCMSRITVEMAEKIPAEQMKKLEKDIYEDSVNGKRLLVDFESVVPEKEKRFTASGKEGISAQLGILQGGAKYMINLNDSHVHTLLTGTVRSGKSNLLRVLVTNILLNYNPSEVEIYLIDYKNGDDFSLFSGFCLPHLRMINLANEPQYVMLILEELQREIDRRATILSQHMNINEYNRLNPDSPLKRIVLVIDELYILVNDCANVDSTGVNRKVMDIIDVIAHEQGAYGVHMFLGAQEITKVEGIDRIVEMCANRILLNTTSGEVSRLLPGRTEAMDMMNGISPEQKGVCVYSDNYGTSESLAYTAELSAEKQKEWLSYIENACKDYSAFTDILVTSPSLDNCHPLTRFMESGDLPDEEPGLMIGQPLRLNEDKKFIAFPRKSLWVLGGDGKAELAGKSAMFYSAASLLMLKKCYARDGRDIRLICCNGMDENIGMIEQDDRFGQLCSDPDMIINEETKEGFIEYVYSQDLKNMILSIYQCSCDRLENGLEKDAVPIWIIIQQMELCWGLEQNEIEKLHSIIRNGDKTDIHLIIWTKSPENSESYQLAKAGCEMLVLETDSLDSFMINRRNLKIQGYTAQYIAQKGARLRIYDYPVIPIVESFLKAFN